MLLAGIILITSYTTKAYIKNDPAYRLSNMTKPQDDVNIPLDEVYNQRPSKMYKTMFFEPSIWNGYESIPSKV